MNLPQIENATIVDSDRTLKTIAAGRGSNRLLPRRAADVRIFLNRRYGKLIEFG